jgi:choline dehydrogenase-like flavoprotein
MFVDGRTMPDGHRVEADLCIVGAGPAGMALALEFADRPNVRVALLETGGLDFDLADQDLADADVVGHEYFPVRETRIRMFGGSTISWGGILSPLDPIDFEDRPWVPNSGWPFGRDELDPYYERSYPLCEVDTSDEGSTIDEIDGSATNSSLAADMEWAPVHFSPPTRFGRTYARRFEASKNIATYLHTTATDIRLTANRGLVDGIEAAASAGNRFVIRARHFVLAGGGIENARLLLTSSDAQPDGIGNSHDVVGRFFQEHPRAINRYQLPEEMGELGDRVVGAAGTLRFSRLGLTDDVQRREQLLNFIVNLSFGHAGQETPQFEAARRIVNASRSPWSDSPYYQDTGGGPNRVRWQDVKTCLMRPDRTVQSLVGAAIRPAQMRRWLQITCSVEQEPRSENRIILTNERDRFGIPKPLLEWTLDDAEERTYRRGMELTLEALETYAPGISRGRFDDPDPWPDDAIGTWHHAGTTRMDTDPARGVVDADCKVHGVDNLFVTGSSVFPTSGATAPTLTIVAMSLRLADHLAPLIVRG